MTEYYAPHMTASLHTSSQMVEWQFSETYKDIITFVKDINNAIRYVHENNVVVEKNGVVQELEKILKRLHDLVDNHPPSREVCRFGNTAFRNFVCAARSEITLFCNQLPMSNVEDSHGKSSEDSIDSLYSEAINTDSVELASYLTCSLGSVQRIDYGTGHELSFVAFLLCLHRLNLVDVNQYNFIGFDVLKSYLYLVRHIQTTYKMEPAGSLGVWSLDDFHIIPYLWGSAQLIHHQAIAPKAMNDADQVESFADAYILFYSLNKCYKVKPVPLEDISFVLAQFAAHDTWQKINDNVIQIYIESVLNKHAVMQHFHFGNLLSFSGAPTYLPMSDMFSCDSETRL